MSAGAHLSVMTVDTLWGQAGCLSHDVLSNFTEYEKVSAQFRTTGEPERPPERWSLHHRAGPNPGFPAAAG